MNVVIQCAGSKVRNAGHLVSASGQPILFVSRPKLAPKTGTTIFYHPDDGSGRGANTWRDEVLEANNLKAAANRVLLESYRLYKPSIYSALVRSFGVRNVFILSAGWGLIRSDYRIPNYDITFSAAAENYKRRTKRDSFKDFNQLPVSGSEPLIFIGGKGYLSLFEKLSQCYPGPRVAYFNSAAPPESKGVRFIQFETPRRTNWHYDCAAALIEQTIPLPK